MRTSMILAICLGLLALPPLAAAQEEAAAATPTPAAEPPAAKSLGHKLVFYLPNRAFDIFDLVRARIRVGPGISVGAHVTRKIEVGIGAHSALWVGLRGPRGEPQIPWPLGVESRAGIKVGVGVATDGPHLGPAEVGGGFQLVLLGLALGVAPMEFVDFAGGFLLWDPIGDDF